MARLGSHPHEGNPLKHFHRKLVGLFFTSFSDFVVKCWLFLPVSLLLGALLPACFTSSSEEKWGILFAQSIAWSSRWPESVAF